MAAKGRARRAGHGPVAYNLARMTAVSVIVPARDAAGTLARTLEALAAQDLAEPYEVIVVDDASVDGTAELAERATGVITVLRHDRPRGPGAARNTGAARARSEFLAFTDADCVPRPEWLREGLEALANADLVQGAVRPDPSVEPRPFDRSVWVGTEVGLYETANLFVRRALFDELDGFEDWLGARIGKPLAEDVWFGWRARRAGARLAFSEAALVYHAVFRRGPFSYIGERLRLTYFADIAEKVPELRRELFFGRVFLNRRTAAFDGAVASVAGALALGSPVALLAAAPYLWIAARSARRWGIRAPLVAAADIVADGVGLGALAAGSVRRRTLVL
jgi:glycosyltransferase involved in cell wall biosynthesis